MLTTKIIHNCLLLLILTAMIACRKEAAIEPSNKKEFQLTITDNPSDPTDHAIYQFYKATGIPLYYNDTVSREQVDVIAGVPVYSYQKLAVRYSPTGTQTLITFTLLSEKENLLPLLPYLKDSLLPQLPTTFPMQSLLVVQSSSQRGGGNLPARRNRPFVGFNTLMLPIVNPDAMSYLSNKKYIADVLATLAYKMLFPTYEKQLAAGFHSITQSTTSISMAIPHWLTDLRPDGTAQLEDFSFLPASYMPALTPGMTPYKEYDLTAYLEAVFLFNNNTMMKFETDFAEYPLIIKKYNFLRKLLKDMGFHIAGL